MEFSSHGKIVTKEFYFQDKKIPIIREDLSTKTNLERYKDALDIIKKENITRSLLLDALEWFFNEDRKIPVSEKLSISEIGFDDKNHIIKVRAQGGGHLIYENRNTIARKTGWYFYVTGPHLPQSELSIRIDQIPKRFDISDLQWDLTDHVPIRLVPVAAGRNKNAFLLIIGSRNILLDSGFSNDSEIRFLKKRAELDAVFISHAHDDHTRMLIELVQYFPDIPVILSQTTLDFFLLKKECLDRDFSAEESALIKNALIVKNGDTIPFNRGTGYFKFFFGGHMPGSLMLFAEINRFRLLFTGDYSFYDYMPIPGIYGVIDWIPSPIDFLLVDGCSSDKKYHRPQYQFDFLRSELTSRAKVNDRVLIVADSASLAIIIFISIHNYFLKLKEEEHFERPIIFLNQKVYEYVKIVYTRLQDLYSHVAESAEKGSIPFQSAMINWIKSDREIIDAEKLLRADKSRGSIVILDPSDLSKEEMFEFLKIVSSDRFNAIYFAGRLKDEIAIELASGKDNLVVNNVTILQNRAQILNRIEPDNILNLHGDWFQLRKLLKKLQPREVCLFHQNPGVLSSVRRWIKEECHFVRETYTIHSTGKEIQIKH